MRSTFFARTRRWIGASALAILVGLGGGSAFLAASSPLAAAQVTPAAEITAPATVTAAPTAGFADLVAAVKPAVVSILVEGREQPSQLDDQGGFNGQVPDLPDNNPLKKFFQQFGNGDGRNGPPQAPQGRRYEAAGSGFVISGDGYIVTNNHVVENATKVTVTFDNGDQKSATVVGVDTKTDLAVVKVDGKSNLPFVKFATDDVRVGDWVVAVGNPFGLGGTVTAGIVSARGRDVQGSQYGDFLQIDAAVNMGNSGGPTFNLKGEVVGVNTEIFSPNGGNVGIAFAIPAATVQQITSSLIKSGTVIRGFLDVHIQDVTRDIADGMGLKSPKGALVTDATADGPGAKAGLKSGDVVTAVNGQSIDNALALSRTIAANAPGATVQLTVVRDGKEQTLSVTLGALKDDATAKPTAPTPPDDQSAAPVTSTTGLTLVPNGGADGGVLVQDVNPNSIAADKGFAVGDTILEVSGTKVANGKQFEDALKAVSASGQRRRDHQGPPRRCHPLHRPAADGRREQLTVTSLTGPGAPAPGPGFIELCSSQHYCGAMKVLLIEDDREAASYLIQALDEAGHVTHHASDGETGYAMASSMDYDVLIVDRMLPRRDGLSIIESLRAEGNKTPVLILSALAEVDDRVTGLRAGGDDYLPKPYAFTELLARIEVLARRSSPSEAATSYEVGDLKLDRLSRKVDREGEPILLQPREFRLLEYLMKNAGKVVTRTMLLENVWDYHFDPQTNVIDVHMSRLRSKIDKGHANPLLHTIRGAGYMIRE